LLPAAQAALDAARAGGSESVSALRLELTIAKLRADWPCVRRSADALIAREPVASLRALLARAQACWHMGELEAAAQAAEQVLAIDPTMTEALIIGAWVATQQGNGSKVLDLYKRLADANPDTPRWPLKRVELLNWLGQVETAVAELNVLVARWPSDPLVRAFLRNFGPGSALARESGSERTEGLKNVFEALERAAPGPDAWKRPLVEVSSELEVQAAAVTGATTAVLVFTGAADGVSMPVRIFDRYLASLSVTVIYLKDFHRLAYLNGIGSLGPSFDATIGALRELLVKFGIERVVTLGNCDGGLAAIRYGIELGAERIIAVGPSTHFTSSPPPLEQARNFKRMRILENVPSEMTDLRPFLQSRDYPSQILVLYMEEDERQRRHALHISNARNVTLQPVAGNQHRSPLHRLALSLPDFQETLAGWLGMAQSGIPT
jgi:tetratricopeptide (TPR) repeat protein